MNNHPPIANQETHRRHIMERFVQSRAGKTCLGAIGLLTVGAALLPEHGGPQSALAQSAGIEAQAPVGLEHVKIDADKMLKPAVLNVSGLIINADALPTERATRSVPKREKSDSGSSTPLIPPSISSPLLKVLAPANNRSRVPVSASPQANPKAEAATNPAPSPEQLSRTMADDILKHPKISFPGDFPRVKQSVEHLRDHGRTFKVDADRIGTDETRVDPDLLLMVLDLADAGIEITLNSLTTGEDHSPNSWHYEGQAVDLKFNKPSDLKKAFAILYKEREKRRINELIHGGELPEGTTNLRKGDKYDYDQKDVLDQHKGHIHVSRTPGPPRTEAAAIPETDKASVIINSQPPGLSAFAGNLLLGPDYPLVGGSRRLPRTPVAEREAPAPPAAMEVQKIHALPAETQARFDAHKPKIDLLTPMYKRVAEAEEIPWQFVAALHYRECGNDPNRSVWAGQPVGSVNWDHGDVKGTTLEADARSAIQHFKMKARTVYGIQIGMNNTLEELKHAFVAYNRGKMYKDANQSVDTSPYAMNGFDHAHENMVWPDSAAEPASTRGLNNNAMGALVIVVGLGLNPN